MEKISSIIGASPRIKAVDIDESHPIRPGTPSFGRPVGSTSSERDRVTLSPMAKEQAFSETLAAHNPRAEASAKLVEETTRKFFGKRMLEVGEDPDEDKVADRAGEVAELEQNLDVRNKMNAAFESARSPMREISGHTLNKYA